MYANVIAFSTPCNPLGNTPPPPFPLHYNFLVYHFALNLKGVAHDKPGSFFPVSRDVFVFCKHYVTYLKVFFLIKMICSLNCPIFFISLQRLIKILLWGLEKTLVLIKNKVMGPCANLREKRFRVKIHSLGGEDPILPSHPIPGRIKER